MLKRDKRLRRERDIDRVYRAGRFGGGKNMTVKYLANGYTDSRVAIVVSKKISKQAVVRNRIKRRLAEIIRESWQTVRPGYDIVISVRSDVSNEAAPALREELISLLRRCGVIETKG